MTQRSRDRNRTTTVLGVGRADGISRSTALAALGPVVYAARLDGLVKFGFTMNLARRLITLRNDNGAAVVELLAFSPGTRDDEAALHARLISWRARGREYYRHAGEVLAEVDTMRRACGLPPLAA